MDLGAIILDLFVTVFFYLLVPVIFCIRKKPMTQKQINRVIWINGAILWLIFRIISIEINGEPGMGAAVFLWSWVGYLIMKRVLLNDAQTNELTYYCQFCGYEQKGDFEICPKCGNNTNLDSDINVEAKQEEFVHQVKNNFCRKCGKKLVEDSVYCSYCGTKIIG